MVLTLHAEDLHVAHGRTEVLRGLTLPPIRSGEVTALLGPNASGKSTLFTCLAGLRTFRGEVWVETPGGRHTPRPGGEPAVVYVPQDLPPAASITVFEAVLLARQQGRRGRVAPGVVDEVGAALVELGIDELATRTLAELSGGQRQVVGLAQAVVRRPAVLLLDEPTNNLDLRNQLQILELVRRLAVEQRTAVLVTVHDLGQAARFADRVVVLHEGRAHASGPPAEVLSPELLRAVYRVEAQVVRGTDGHLTLTVTRSL